MMDRDTSEVIGLFADDREMSPIVRGWLEDMAKRHVPTDEAMEQLKAKMEKQLSDGYDRIHAKAKGPVEQLFFWYPRPDWREVKRYFEEDYLDLVQDKDRSARAGGIVSREYYEEMMDVVPPLDAPKEILSKYGCTRGFLMGEPWGTGPGGVNTYRAFGMRPDGKCIYLGLSPRAKDSEYPGSSRSWNGKASQKRSPPKKGKPAKRTASKNTRSGSKSRSKGAKR